MSNDYPQTFSTPYHRIDAIQQTATAAVQTPPVKVRSYMFYLRMANLGLTHLLLDCSSFQDMETRVRTRLSETGHDAALVSIVFAPPRSAVFEDLSANFAYYNLRSGLNWDLFFAGYGARHWGRFSRKAQRSADFFSPRNFLDLSDGVTQRHVRELSTTVDTPPGLKAWHYSGKCDLVSVMAYRGDGQCSKLRWDWLSLRAVSLTDSTGRYEQFSLGEVVELASRWRDDPDELRVFAPGESPVVGSVMSLGAALGAVGAAVASGVAGNSAYDLLKQIIQ